MSGTPKVSLEVITDDVLVVREVARLCKDEDLILAIARLRDELAKHEGGAPRLEARHQAIQQILAERGAGKNKRVWWAWGSAYQGTQWAVLKLTGLSRA